jgi:hypothetical protein
MPAPFCIYNYICKKNQPAAALVQLLYDPVPKNLHDLLLRLAPGGNRLFQELASLGRQSKRLRRNAPLSRAVTRRLHWLVTRRHDTLRLKSSIGMIRASNRPRDVFAIA